MLRRRVLAKSGQAVDVNTLMLLHFDGDLTGISTIGNMSNISAGYDSSDKVFGVSSVYNLNYSAGAAARFPSSLIGYLVNDFTIDFWAKPWQDLPDNTGTGLLDLGTNTNGSLLPYIYVYFGRYDGAALIEAIMYDSVGDFIAYRYKYLPNYPTIWCHIALVRYQDNLYLFFNGQLMSTPGDDYPAIAAAPTVSQSICTILPYSASKIDELRISNIARWTANFTPPAAPY